MQALDRRLLALTRWLATIGLIGLFANALAVVLDVALRAAFNAPIDRLSDVSQLITFTAAACCLPATTARRQHITIRALERLRWPRLREGIEAFAALLGAALFTLIAWQAFAYAAETARSGETLSQIRISVAPFWTFVAGCITLTALIQAFIALRHLLAAAGGPSAAPPAEDGAAAGLL